MGMIPRRQTSWTLSPSDHHQVAHMYSTYNNYHTADTVAANTSVNMSGYYQLPMPGQHVQHHAQPVMFRPSRAEDWEPYRDVIAHMYNTMKLKDVMTEMEVNYHFKATEKQYKTQLKKWNLDTKYIKAWEYMAMIQIMREREAQNPPKQTRFILRGRAVDPKDIARFEKRAQKKGVSMDDETLDSNEPVEDLVYRTPSPEPSYSYASSSQYNYSYDSSYDM